MEVDLSHSKSLQLTIIQIESESNRNTCMDGWIDVWMDASGMAACVPLEKTLQNEPRLWMKAFLVHAMKTAQCVVVRLLLCCNVQWLGTVSTGYLKTLSDDDSEATQRCKRSAKTYWRATKVQNGQFALMPEKTSQAFQGLKQALDDARSAKEHRQMGALLATGSTEKGISMQMSLLLTESSSIFEMPLPLMFCFEIRILQIIVMNHGVGVFKLHQKYCMLLDKGMSNLPVAR